MRDRWKNRRTDILRDRKMPEKAERGTPGGKHLGIASVSRNEGTNITVICREGDDEFHSERTKTGIGTSFNTFQQCCGSGSVRIHIIFQVPDPFPGVLGFGSGSKLLQ
jgi:hypothetical protein